MGAMVYVPFIVWMFLGNHDFISAHVFLYDIRPYGLNAWCCKQINKPIFVYSRFRNPLQALTKGNYFLGRNVISYIIEGRSQAIRYTE